jgi:cellulose biosynthesis protein BcsQ
MLLYIIDPDTKFRDELSARTHEALRQAGLKRVEVVEGDFSLLQGNHNTEEIACCFLGPGCYEQLEDAIGMFKGVFPDKPVALILDNDRYSTEAVELRRLVNIRIMPIADLAQMAGFILDCESQLGTAPGSKNRGIVSVVQLKGGVGTSTIAAGLAACWARHDLSVALVDFDDVNPQITDWGRVGSSQRRAMSEMLQQGEVPKYRINELAHPVEGFNGKLVVIGQPERYQESFHFKADILDGAPSAAVFVNSLLNVLRDEFDVVVIDTGRSWGVTTFSVLPLSQQVLLVTDDDGMSVRRTLDNLHRLTRESDDPSEFDLSKWSLVLNSYTGKLLSPKDLSIEIRELDLFPDTATLYTVPYSPLGRQWGGPGQSFYEMVDEGEKAGIRKIAFSIVPFKQEIEIPLVDKLRNKFQKLVTPPKTTAPPT